MDKLNKNYASKLNILINAHVRACVCELNLSSEEFTVLLAPLLSLDLRKTSQVVDLFSQVVGLLQQLLNHPVLLLLLALLLSNHKLEQKKKKKFTFKV